MKNNLLFILLVFLSLGACKKDASQHQDEIASARAAGDIVAPFTKNGNEILVSTFNGQFLDAGSNPTANYIFPKELDTAAVKTILMEVKLAKHSANKIGEYDVFGRIGAMVKSPTDPNALVNMELGRFITPFGKENTSLPNGYVVDVTDFKSVLKNTVSLTSFAESYSGGWALDVTFRFILGTPDFKYYAIAPVMNYANSSQSILFGEGAVGKNITNFKNGYTIKVPQNTEKTSIRTIITGWGNASPMVNRWEPAAKNGYAAANSTSGGNINSGYAEFAYSTHRIKINTTENDFEVYMGPLGCGGENKNQVQNQFGSWSFQRAGWCPGMVVPVRNDVLTNAHAGGSFDYLFKFKDDWTNDGKNGSAYFSLTSYVVVKSNTPINFASDYLK